MDITVASIADIEEITQVEIASKKQSLPSIIEDIDINYAVRLSRWQTYFAGKSPASAKPDRIIFKAVDANRVIGYVAVHLTTRFDMDAEIQSFYILNEYQRKGIGSKLFGYVLNWLAAFNVKNLCVGIAADNPYQVFYLKHGGKYYNPHWIFWDNLDVSARQQPIG